MDVRPSSTQQLLVASARDFLRRHYPLDQVPVRALDAQGFDDKLWRAMAELGWPGLLVPPALGGSGGSLLDVILLVEEMGYAGLPGPYVTSAVAVTTALLATESAPPSRRLLPALASGERIATLAVVEEDGVYESHAVSLACDGAGRLSGRKLFVKDAHIADEVVVVVREGTGFGLLALPTARPGIGRQALDTISGEKLFAVTFDGVEVRAEDRLGPSSGEGLAAALQAGALARTAEMVGAAQRILELTVEHAKARVQGGRPIGAYQAIQHACADLVRDVDASRALLHTAAWAVSEGAAAGADVAIAKAYAGEACLAAARRSHQIFGAISYCEEHPLHVFHKRIQAASLDFGDAAVHLETVAQAIGLEDPRQSDPCAKQ